MFAGQKQATTFQNADFLTTKNHNKYINSNIAPFQTHRKHTPKNHVKQKLSEKIPPRGALSRETVWVIGVGVRPIPGEELRAMEW